ncbi:VIT1/CCC1 transporter family protein [Mannheimia varigena]|uniref:VIT1/CCC1 transporter family protein n=1 Tax=Mannheimia varigena TaxID=85404 RepID=UPI0015B6563F|nr:VIT family protein [Mannheimia varigena]QLD34059.1 VIT family protein [Mannheimia varigena]
MSELEDYIGKHYIHRSNWLRAAVLGVNDGIISTSSLAIGVTVASSTVSPVIVATIAGIVAGALSMAAGEFVSVSSQTDIEQADIERERKELEEDPETELRMLAKIYENRGLTPETAQKVAEELTAHNALAAHTRDELGITETSVANPLQASMASAISFLVGGVLPLLVVLLIPFSHLEVALYIASVLFLGLSGGLAAKAGGANIKKAIIRIVFWGTIAMGVSAFVGSFFGVNA